MAAARSRPARAAGNGPAGCQQARLPGRSGEVAPGQSGDPSARDDSSGATTEWAAPIMPGHRARSAEGLPATSCPIGQNAPSGARDAVTGR